MAQYKTYEDPILGPVVFCRKKGVRRIRLKVHPVKGVSVTMPWLMPFFLALAFFHKERDWAVRTLSRQKELNPGLKPMDADQIESMRRQAKAILPQRLAELASRYGFVYNRVAIKHNSSNWGSCSSKDNINLNLNIMRLPEVLQDYILLHELCHLRHRNHGEEFHALLDSLLKDNLGIRISQGDAAAEDMLSAVMKSRSARPYDYVMSREVKKYRLI